MKDQSLYGTAGSRLMFASRMVGASNARSDIVRLIWKALLLTPDCEAVYLVHPCALLLAKTCLMQNRRHARS